MVVTVTERLLLRRPKESDREPFRRMNSHPLVSLSEVVSFTVPANRRSRRVMEKIGRTRDPVDDLEHPAIAEGHPLRTHVLYRARPTFSAAETQQRQALL